jgi:phage shock protein A
MASLVYTDGDTVEYSFTVGADPVLVGRAPECAIRSNHPLVSRNHARFYVDPAGTLYIEDLGSANGVYVGQQRVSHSAVPVGEIVVVGSLTFRQMPDAQAANPYGQPPNGHAPPEPYGQPQANAHGQPPAYPPPAEPHAAPPPPNAFAPQPGDVSTQPASHAYGQPPGGNGHAPPGAGMAPPQPMAAPAMPPPMAAPAMPPPMAPPAMPPPAVAGPDSVVAHLLETERKTRVAAEEERDAYGARMAELHGELRSLRQQLEQLQAHPPQAAAPARNPELEQRLGELLAERTKAMAELGGAKEKIARLEAQLQAVAAAGGGEARLASLESELEAYRERVTDADDRVEAAESRLASCEEELSVARTDLLQSEERMMSEMAASEQRASAELAMRVDELNVARADVTNAEERVMDLSRKVSELEQQLAQARGAF